MIEGTINVHRRIFEDPMFADEPFSRREAWLWLIATAVFRPYRISWMKHTILLERGQLVASYAQMARSWGWHKDKVRSFIRRLKAEGMIEVDPPQATPQGTPPLRITICNYDKYQAQPAGEATPQATPQATHKNEGSKNEGYKKLSPAHARAGASRLPEGWEPDPFVWAKLLNEYGDRLDCQATLDHFRDWWWSSTKANAIKKDWNAALRVWFRNEVKNGRPPRQTPDDKRAESRARLRAAVDGRGLLK